MCVLLFQGSADFALQKDTAVCRSGIAGAGTAVAQELDEEEDGVQSLLTTTKINCGGTAEEDDDVRM